MDPSCPTVKVETKDHKKNNSINITWIIPTLFDMSSNKSAASRNKETAQIVQERRAYHFWSCIQMLQEKEVD